MPSLSDLSLTDTLRAFRQAKAALLEERCGLYSTQLAEFEANLGPNIRELHRALSGRQATGTKVGRVIVLPKRTDGRKLSVQAQLLQSFEAAILDINWLWSFGGFIEATIEESCVSNRLKVSNGKTNRQSRYIYQPWSDSYEAFHRDVRRAAIRALKSGKRCSICTFDIQSYYDSIDTRFLVGDLFLAQLQQAALAVGIVFNRENYVAETRDLIRRGVQFQRGVARVSGVRRSVHGLPIGAIASRLIANVALAELDRYVATRSDVLHYARWVDDIVLVLADGAPLQSNEIAQALFPMAAPDTIDSVTLHRAGSDFRLNDRKARVFALEGEEGLDLLASVAAEVDAVGSYRGAFGAALDRREQRAELLEIVRQQHGTEEGAFQYIDGLRVRRAAAAALVTKSVEAAKLTLGDPDSADSAPLRALARTLGREREWVDFVDIVIRAIGAAILGGDGRLCGDLLSTVETWIRRIGASTAVSLGGLRARKTMAADACTWFRERVRQAIAGAVKSTTGDERPTWLPAGEWNWDAIRAAADSYRRSDLRLLDREDDHRWTGTLSSSLGSVGGLDRVLARELSDIEIFIKVAKQSGDPIYGDVAPLDVWLSRRPPSLFDISWRWVRSQRRQSVPPINVINAVRGTNYKAPIAEEVSKGKRSAVIALGTIENKPSVRVALGNVSTTEDWFTRALKGTPAAGRKRLLPLIQVVQNVRRLIRRDEHLLLVLPEVSTPRAVLRMLTQSLLKEDIGLVAGLEYERRGRRVFNEVVAVIPRGFGSSVTALWRKTLPAVGNEADALRSSGAKLARARQPAGSHVVDSQFGTIGVLICSELLEIKARARLAGRVDLMLVPSWNKDTTSFEQLIQGAALDVHCFIGVSNNAEYSDCRMRAPIDDPPALRDMCRLIERGENTVVSASPDVEQLRAFQQGKIKKGFKPVPPGFKYARPRRSSSLQAFLAALAER